MGHFVKYRAYYACEAFKLFKINNNNESIVVPPFKVLNSDPAVEKNTLGFYNSLDYNDYASLKIITNFAFLIPKATGDLYSDYSVEDYQLTELGSMNYNNGIFLANDKFHRYYNCVIFNNTEQDIVVNCIKFVKQLPTSYSSSNRQIVDTLYCAYFLDAPITIHPNDSDVVNVNFEGMVGR